MSFDRIAPFYRLMESVLAGGTLQRARTAWLGAVGQPRRALLVGEGPGRFLDAALTALPRTEFDCVDASAEMLRVASRGVQAADRDRVRFRREVLPKWSPEPDTFDLLVTHCFLDCFPATELEAIVAGLAGAARPGARWLLADFAMPKRGWTRWRARAIHAVMYGFFRWATGVRASALVAPQSAMARHGFELCGRKEFEWGLIGSELWSLAPPRWTSRAGVG